MDNNIGYHIPITGDELPPLKSLQMFLLPPNELFDKTVGDRMPIYKHVVEEWKSGNSNRKMFVHGSYTINLSNPAVFSVNALKNQLKLAREVSASGLVIHCGKSLKDTKESATQRFLCNVDVAIERATLECPLLIETSVGAGTELFYKCDEFCTMVNTLRARHGEKVGAVIDSAHVWGAGYEPTEFVNSMDQNARNGIKLIHFNNSEVIKGSKVDRHAPIESGLIQTDELWRLEKWAIGCNIPVVKEC